MFFLPSEEKARNFFELGIKNKSRFFTKVTNRNEEFEMAKFYEKGVNSSKFSCRISSIQSSISCGLNLPNHPFLFVSFDVFRPIVTLFRHTKTNDVYGAQSLDAYYIIKQAIGRIARKTDYEKANPNVPSKRIIFVTAASKFPTLVEHFFEDSAKSYKRVSLYDISDYDKEAANLFRRNKGLIVLKNFQKNFPDQMKGIFSHNFEKVEDLKMFFFEFLFKHITLDEEKQQDFDFDNNFYKIFLQFLLYSLVADVSYKIGKAMFDKKNPTEKNPFGLSGSYGFLKTQAPERKNEKLQVLYYAVKDDIRFFLAEEKRES